MGLKIKGDKPPATKSNPYDEHLKSTPVMGTTQIDTKALKEDWVEGEMKQETINKGVIIPASERCEITFEGGRTINLGKFNSARISCSIRVPCHKNDLEATYEFASDWVSNKIMAATEGMGEE